MRTADGMGYCTLAGCIINQAVALFQRKPQFKADIVSLLVPSPIDWPSIPTDASGYREISHMLFEPSSGQSLYQQQLPLDLQKREYLQEWLRDKETPSILGRLSNVGTVQMVDSRGLERN